MTVSDWGPPLWTMYSETPPPRWAVFARFETKEDREHGLFKAVTALPEGEGEQPEFTLLHLHPDLAAELKIDSTSKDRLIPLLPVIARASGILSVTLVHGELARRRRSQPAPLTAEQLHKCVTTGEAEELEALMEESSLGAPHVKETLAQPNPFPPYLEG